MNPTPLFHPNRLLHNEIFLDEGLEQLKLWQAKNTREEVKEVLKTPSRLMYGLSLWKKMLIKGDIKTEGMENLDLIPPGKKVVFAPTHISDGDMPVAALVLGDRFKLGIANQSMHHHLTGEPPMYLGLLMAGKDNFYPMDFDWIKLGKKKGKIGRFNPDNYLAMRDAMANEGKAMVMAAHSPTFNSKLPDRGGIAAAYLAAISDAVIVPVAIDYQSEHTITAETHLKNATHRAEVKAIIGKPIEPKPIKGIERFPEIFKKDKEKMASDEERAELKRIRQSLSQDSDELMRQLADLLPEKKRGKWHKEKNSQNPNL
jgi:hypothetical protein